MKKTLIALSVVALLNGCAVIQSTGLSETDPTVTGQMKGVKKEFDTIPSPAAGKQVSVAVYSFADKTDGERRLFFHQPQPQNPTIKGLRPFHIHNNHEGNNVAATQSFRHALNYRNKFGYSAATCSRVRTRAKSSASIASFSAVTSINPHGQSSMIL